MTAAILLLTQFGDDAPAPATYRYATKEYTNPEAGYSFRYPPSWNLQEFGTIARVRSPARDIVVSFGLGTAGDLRDAAVEFVGRVAESYRGPTLSDIEIQELGGSLAAFVSGTGTNRGGVRIRFLAITVAAERNYSIAVFTAEDSDPARVVPRAQEIVNSFRPA